MKKFLRFEADLIKNALEAANWQHHPRRQALESYASGTCIYPPGSPQASTIGENTGQKAPPRDYARALRYNADKRAARANQQSNCPLENSERRTVSGPTSNPKQNSARALSSEPAGNAKR